MNRYLYYLILFPLLVYILVLCFSSIETASTIVLAMVFTVLLFHPEKMRQSEDYGEQLFNLQPIGIDRPGYVYILKSDKGYYKIGRSFNPMNRIKIFNVRLPMHVKYVVLIKTSDMNALEAHFHTQYSHKHEAGEWFRLNQNDINWLKGFPGALTAQELQQYNSDKRD